MTKRRGDTKVDEGSDPWGLTPDAEVGSDSTGLTPDADEGSDPTGQTPDVEAPGETSAGDPLLQLTKERDEYLGLLQRVQADFENYRKRAAREQERLVAHAHERLVRELLPVLDDLERALEAAERHEEATLVEGVRLVEQALRSALVKEGLAEIPTGGQFDPHVHEALLTQPSEQAESGAVLEVVQRGYRLGDKVVRPARVIVAE